MGFLWRIAMLGAAVGAAPGTGATIEIRGQVVDAAGNGVVGVAVFALDSRSQQIASSVLSAEEGRFTATVPRGRYQLGIVNPRWTVVRVEKPRRNEIRLIVRAQDAPAPGDDGTELEVVATSARRRPALEMVTGRVISETGIGLGGVGLTLMKDGQPVGATYSGAHGEFASASRPGRQRLVVAAPGLRVREVKREGANHWRITLAVMTETSTVRVEIGGDPDNPTAPERAMIVFKGGKVSGLPVVSPTLADLEMQSGSARHPVARQPAGALCIRSLQCDQRRGVAVCCAANGDLTDDYLAITPGGISGACKLARDCPGARAHRRIVVGPAAP